MAHPAQGWRGGSERARARRKREERERERERESERERARETESMAKRDAQVRQTDKTKRDEQRKKGKSLVQNEGYPRTSLG